jgi:hypothetical protein
MCNDDDELCLLFDVDVDVEDDVEDEVGKA